MLLLPAVLLLPVILGADQEWNFEKYIVKTNENNTLIGVEITTLEDLYELDLSNLGLEGIDSNAFSNVTNIKTLDLSNNWLTTLPQYSFSNFNNLQHLSLADNNISSLDGVFISQGYLSTLDLSNNQIEHIEESYLYGLGKYVNCIIWTRGNGLSNISTLLFENPYDPPEKIILVKKSDVPEKLTNLSTIDFSTVKECNDCYWRGKLNGVILMNQITLVECTQVKVDHTDLRLSFIHNSINYENVGIEVLNYLAENIVEVDLSHNQIYTLKSEIENQYCRTLILDNNIVFDIIDNLFAKTNLSVLSLNHNFLRNTEFTKTLPSSLEEIRLSDNIIGVISRDSFSRLKNLVKLDLSHNILRNIEAGSFRNLGALRELNLFNNQIYLYKGIFAGLRSIEYLNVGMNRLNETKNILFAMPDTLATVILDSNKIESLEVGSFVRVPKHKLSLKGNNIQNFVEGSFNLPNLEELDLGSNKLRQLNYQSFEGLANLKQLSLAGNEISTLNSDDLSLLRKLEILDISSNPINTLSSGAFRNMIKSRRSVVLVSGVPIETMYSSMFL